MKKRNLKNRILALATCTLVLISSLMLPIGAEDATVPAAETKAYTSTIDWSAFPGSNLTIIKEETKTHNGITFTSDINGITVNGTATGTASYFTQSLPLKAGETYCISSNITDENESGPDTFQLWCRAKNKEIKEIYNIKSGETFSPQSDCTIEISIYIYTGCTINNLTIKPMLNKGETAYPYMPYLPYYFEQAFNNGYSQGNDSYYQEGYNEGFNEALGKHECDRNTHFVYNSSSYINAYNLALTEEIIADFTDEEKHLFAIGYADAAAGNGTYHYTCCANKSWLYTYGDEIYWLNQGYQEGQWEALGLYDCKWHDIAPEHPTYVTGYNDAYEYSAKYTELTEEERWLYAQGWADKTYNLGFHYTCCASKNQAYIKGYEEANTERYNAGYNAGKKTGYQEGLETAEKGTWENLIGAVVEAPVNAFQGLFNFEIMGLNMQAAFGSMLAICVLLIIVKKVVM